jgi:hypothetical protein
MIQNRTFRKICRPKRAGKKKKRLEKFVNGELHSMSCTLKLSRMSQLSRMGHELDVANLGELGSAYRNLTGRQRRKVILEAWALTK